MHNYAERANERLYKDEMKSFSSAAASWKATIFFDRRQQKRFEENSCNALLLSRKINFSFFVKEVNEMFTAASTFNLELIVERAVNDWQNFLHLATFEPGLTYKNNSIDIPTMK